MCIVVDTCAFSSVFNERSKDHNKFEPVKKWITKGPGFMVYGGSRYHFEIKNSTKFIGVIIELRKAGRAKEIVKAIVDQEELLVKSILQDCRCNDTHLIAIIRASGCKLICSADRKSDRFLKRRSLYIENQSPPKIYRSRAHKDLLISTNIVAIRNTT